MTVSSALLFPVSALPHDPLTPLDPNERPTPLTICKLQLKLYDNARAITSPLGGGNHGHLGMLMTQAAYAALPGTAQYNFPNRPVLPDNTGMKPMNAPMLKTSSKKNSNSSWKPTVSTRKSSTSS